MIREVDAAHRVVKEGTDDLAEIRRMIQKTKYNINTHITTVDQLKNQLTTITEKSKDALSNKAQLRTVQSQKSLVQNKLQKSGN